MKSIIKKFFGNKKIIHDSDEYKSCESEKILFKKVEIKKKEISNFECNDLFLLNIDDIEDNIMLKKNIKNCCQNGKFENLLLYNLDNVEKNFLKPLQI